MEVSYRDEKAIDRWVELIPHWSKGNGVCAILDEGKR
jgi:hypothetical protein